MTKLSNFHKRTYILIHLVLFIPVLLWPVPAMIFQNPMLMDSIMATWLICIAVQLMVSVSMDTMLYPFTSFRQSMEAALWVCVFAIATISQLQRLDSAWLFGILFLMHSVRAAHLLMGEKNNVYWWLWLAWGRDIASATVIFLWSAWLL